MYQFIRNNFQVPLDSIVCSQVWLNSKFATIHTGGSTFRDICDVIHSEILHYTIIDLERFWVNQKYLRVGVHRKSKTWIAVL
jgi:hypothetical protein